MAALIIAVVVVGYLGHLYLHPFGQCRRCRGRGTNRGSRPKAFGNCKRCKGTRTRQRLGSKTVHRAVRSLVAARNNRKDR